jgi:hypothetical protein
VRLWPRRATREGGPRLPGGDRNPRSGYSRRVGKARKWLQEERRKTLGDWVAFCLDCGFTLRYFDESAGELPSSCPTCGGEVRAECPACRARFASAFTVECERCGEAVRPREAFGVPIRRDGP